MDFAYALKLPRKKEITGKILKNAEKIICANSHTANLVKNFDNGLVKKTAVINPGVDTRIIRNPEKTDEFRKKYGLKNKIILLSLGRLVKRKGFDRVIESLPEIFKIFPNLIYVIAGAGEEEKNLKNRAAELPAEVEKKIIFFGKASEEESFAWLEACDIFIMPSREINGDFEGFGIVYLEANLFGKPVIAGKSGGVADAVIDNVTGLLIDPKNIDEISQAVIKLAQNEKLRHELGEAGKRRAVVNFDWKKQTEKIVKLLNC